MNDTEIEVTVQDVEVVAEQTADALENAIDALGDAEMNALDIKELAGQVAEGGHEELFEEVEELAAEIAAEVCHTIRLEVLLGNLRDVLGKFN